MTLWKDASRKERTETVLQSERRREMSVWTHPERMARRLLRDFKEGRMSKEQRSFFLKMAEDTR